MGYPFRYCCVSSSLPTCIDLLHLVKLFALTLLTLRNVFTSFVATASFTLSPVHDPWPSS